MTLANELAVAGCTPQRIATTATVTMEARSVGRTITGIQFDVLAEVPRLKQNDFIRAAIRAKTNCTVSRLLKTNISMSARLQIAENRRLSNSLKVSKTKKQSISRASLER